MYLSSKHQSRGNLGGMTYPNRVLSKYLPLVLAIIHFIALTRVSITGLILANLSFGYCV